MLSHSSTRAQTIVWSVAAWTCPPISGSRRSSRIYNQSQLNRIIPSYALLSQTVFDWEDEWVVVPASNPMSTAVIESSVHSSPWQLIGPTRWVIVDRLHVRLISSTQLPFHSKLSCNWRNSTSFSSSPVRPSPRCKGNVNWATSASICLNPLRKASGSYEESCSNPTVSKNILAIDLRPRTLGGGDAAWREGWLPYRTLRQAEIAYPFCSVT